MYKNLVNELHRAVDVLGKYKAECQNHTDIEQWKSYGLITTEQAKDLHKLNREITR